jgi:hypothetical protein
MGSAAIKRVVRVPEAERLGVPGASAVFVTIREACEAFGVDCSPRELADGILRHRHAAGIAHIKIVFEAGDQEGRAMAVALDPADTLQADLAKAACRRSPELTCLVTALTMVPGRPGQSGMWTEAMRVRTLERLERCVADRDLRCRIALLALFDHSIVHAIDRLLASGGTPPNAGPAA